MIAENVFNWQVLESASQRETLFIGEIRETLWTTSLGVISILGSPRWSGQQTLEWTRHPSGKSR